MIRLCYLEEALAWKLLMNEVNNTKYKIKANTNCDYFECVSFTTPIIIYLYGVGR